MAQSHDREPDRLVHHAARAIGLDVLMAQAVTSCLCGDDDTGEFPALEPDMITDPDDEHYEPSEADWPVSPENHWVPWPIEDTYEPTEADWIDFCRYSDRAAALRTLHDSDEREDRELTMARLHEGVSGE
jgi:hypothetical protein